jgi:hypothetical protein
MEKPNIIDIVAENDWRVTSLSPGNGTMFQLPSGKQFFLQFDELWSLSRHYPCRWVVEPYAAPHAEGRVKRLQISMDVLEQMIRTWVGSCGTMYNVEDMSADHIKNAVTWLENRGPGIKGIRWTALDLEVRRRANNGVPVFVLEEQRRSFKPWPENWESVSRNPIPLQLDYAMVNDILFGNINKRAKKEKAMSKTTAVKGKKTAKPVKVNRVTRELQVKGELPIGTVSGYILYNFPPVKSDDCKADEAAAAQRKEFSEALNKASKYEVPVEVVVTLRFVEPLLSEPEK